MPRTNDTLYNLLTVLTVQCTAKNRVGTTDCWYKHQSVIMLERYFRFAHASDRTCISQLVCWNILHIGGKNRVTQLSIGIVYNPCS